MKLQFKPIAKDTCGDLDGYTKREGFIGPIRIFGTVHYYDPTNGNYFNPKTREYVEWGRESYP